MVNVSKYCNAPIYCGCIVKLLLIIGLLLFRQFVTTDGVCVQQWVKEKANRLTRRNKAASSEVVRGIGLVEGNDRLNMDIIQNSTQSTPNINERYLRVYVTHVSQV